MIHTRLVLGLLVLAGCGSSPDPGGLAPDASPADGPDAVSPDARVPPEIDGLITINELMAANAVTIADGAGVAGDWIELYNAGDDDVALEGYGITDDLTAPSKAVIPAGVVIPAGGHVLLWTGDLGFALAKEMGEVGLARPDGTWIDRVHYGAQEVDLSAAREPDGSDLWRIEWHPSPGAANPGGDGQPAGLENPAAPPEEVPGVGDLSEQILGYDVLLEIGLEVPPASVASLEAEPFQYVPAHLVYAGRSYGPIGVRLKGQNSFLPFSQKPSLRISVDEYVGDARFFGLKDLTLNNMSGDLTMMHERLAYLVARTAGVPASRANHALLTINDQFYGLYVNVETVKHKMLSRWFENEDGSLFEATDVDFVAGDIADYELEDGPDDRSLLTGLAGALALPGDGAAITAAASYANLGQFQTFWAMCSVVGQFDSFPYSIPGDDYFVYADPTSGRLWFMPWGMDETFYSGSHDVTNVYSVLARRCKAVPSCFQAYVDRTWELVSMTEELGLEGERAEVAAQIAPYVVMDTRKPYSTAQVTAAQTAMHWFITERRAHLAEILPPP